MTIEQLHATFIDSGSRLATDSRKIEGGEVFWALRGENFDGNDYALKALEAGASHAVVDRVIAGAENDPRIWVVDNSLTALHQFACYHREHTLHAGKRIPVLALTGTNGKTTTKELIRAVLGTKYKIVATEGNLNNNIGVPLTLLRLTQESQMAVVEMGASHPGDIRELVDIAHPDFGLITNVGRAHLLGFGSFEGVKATKGELYDYLSETEGCGFVNTASADLVQMAGERGGMKRVDYGTEVQKAKVLPCTAEHPFLRMDILADGHLQRVNTQLVGSYNADNVLAAFAVGAYFGISAEDAAAAIEAYTPSNKRSQMMQSTSNTLILDAYNANPSSMEAALTNFASIQAPRKGLMLGDMLELGDESELEHRKVLDKVAQLKAELVILVGKEFAKAATEKEKTDWLFFETSEQAASYLHKHKVNSLTILVKGSRGTRMENLIPAL